MVEFLLIADLPHVSHVRPVNEFLLTLGTGRVSTNMMTEINSCCWWTDDRRLLVES